MAARPDAKARARSPPSSAARHVSSAVAGRVAAPRIFVSLVLARCFLGERGGRVDRDDGRPRGRVGAPGRHESRGSKSRARHVRQPWVRSCAIRDSIRKGHQAACAGSSTWIRSIRVTMSTPAACRRQYARVAREQQSIGFVQMHRDVELGQRPGHDVADEDRFGIKVVVQEPGERDFLDAADRPAVAGAPGAARCRWPASARPPRRPIALGADGHERPRPARPEQVAHGLSDRVAA